MNKAAVPSILVSVVLLALGAIAEAQQIRKVHRIGMLFFGSREQPHLASFQRGLRDLGYVEAKNIVIEYRYAEGKAERLPKLAAELVRLEVDVIVTTTNRSAHAARQVTKTIPIVLTTGDPVGGGLAASLAKPGGNVTGLTVLPLDLSGKRLELLKETFPKATRVAVLWNPANQESVAGFKEAQVAAQSFSLQLESLEARSAEDIDAAFAGATKLRSNAFLTILDPLTTLNSKRIVELAAKKRWPGIYPTRQFVEEGGLMAYGVNIADLYHRAATYVDKILKGAKPADLPVEQPTKFELVINLKTAKQIGLTIPQSVLYRADKVIK
jgi:putative ABC transport system substrate-binding protein